MLTLLDKGIAVATLTGSTDEMVEQATRAIAALGHAHPASIRASVGCVVESNAVAADIPEMSASGRCWSRWVVRKA